MDRATRGRSNGSGWKCVPRTGSVVTRSRNDVLPVRRVSNRLNGVGMPLERLTDCGTSLGIPDSNGVVTGSGDDVAPIGRVSNGRHPVNVPLEWVTDCGTSPGIPGSNGVIV